MNLPCLVSICRRLVKVTINQKTQGVKANSLLMAALPMLSPVADRIVKRPSGRVWMIVAESFHVKPAKPKTQPLVVAGVWTKFPQALFLFLLVFVFFPSFLFGFRSGPLFSLSLCFLFWFGLHKSNPADAQKEKRKRKSKKTGIARDGKGRASPFWLKHL